MGMVKGLFRVSPPKSKANFQAVLKQYNISEATLKRRQRGFLHLTILSALSLVLMLSYVTYLLIAGSYRGAMVGTGVSGLLLSMTFRYHFWYFQIQQRRLGCSFNEWFQQGILGRKL